MKVALVTDKFITGGGLEHIYQICKGMPDIEFGVFANGGSDYEKFNKLKNVKLFFSYRKKEIKKFSPDIVHIHHLKPLMKLYNINFAKKIFTVHGIHLHKYEFMKGVKPKILKFLRMNLEKYLYSKMDEIITVSDDDKEYLERFYGIKSTVIYNGIDIQPILEIKETKEELREKYNFPKDKILCITIARFDFSKDYYNLVKLIYCLNKKNTNFYFIFVGDGKNKIKIEQIVKQLKINNILFLGKRKDIYYLLKASDVFILPSKWEGLPISAIEALACGNKLLLSNTYGNKTLKRLFNKSAFLYENNNCIDFSLKLINLINESYVVNDLSKVTKDFMLSKLKDLYRC